MYVYIYIYIHTHTHTHIYIYTYIFFTIQRRWSARRNTKIGIAVTAACHFGHACHRFASTGLVNVGASLNLATSAIIRTFKKFRWIRAFSTLTSTFSAKKVTRPIRNLLERMETWLSIWVDVQTQRNRPLS